MQGDLLLNEAHANLSLYDLSTGTCFSTALESNATVVSSIGVVSTAEDIVSEMMRERRVAEQEGRAVHSGFIYILPAYNPDM